ncbi:UNVERIFIED_CONTAM: hypothetical protein GTU68_016643 [Idotea baltica]|nr:hypothetical protein [Idotea baltica]
MSPSDYCVPSPATIKNALETASRYLDESGCFFGHGTDNAWDDAVQILFWVLGLDDDPGIEILAETLEPDCVDRFQKAINLRASEKLPTAYITGDAWFCGLKFEVNSSVLIPRSPIGELIQNDYSPWIAAQPETVLDLCCGSGCIGIAAAIFNESALVTVADISSEAIAIAERNIERFDLKGRVHTCESDLFQQLRGKRFDLILTNPPYVDFDDLSSMPKEYLHEPKIALGSGSDGLDITRRILSKAKDHLTADGALILEVGNSAEHLEQAYPEFPFTWISFTQGGHGVCAIQRKELEEGAF